MAEAKWRTGGRGLAGRVAVVLLWFGCQDHPPGDAPPPAPPTLQERHEAVKTGMADLVASLTAEGVYHCCVSVPCRWCALQTAGCACGPGLERGEPVCEECALMWTKGLGSVEGVDPDGVRSFLEAMREDPWCGRTPPEASAP